MDFFFLEPMKKARSCRILNINEHMGYAHLLRNVRCQCRRPVTLTGMVTTGQKRNAAFTGVMGLRL
jgi:hypothetical protein